MKTILVIMAVGIDSHFGEEIEQLALAGANNLPAECAESSL